MISVGSGEAVIYVGANIPPFRVGLDHVTVIVLLKLNGDHLINVICGYTAISCYTQDTIIIDHWTIRCRYLLDTLSSLGIDLVAQRLLSSGTFRFKPCSRRTDVVSGLLLLKFIGFSTSLFFSPWTYVFQGMATPIPMVFEPD